MAKKNYLLEYSEMLACEVAQICHNYKIDSNTAYQIKKSSTSVFANISEAQYPQSLADMHSKFEIARKECSETESWLKLIFSSGIIDEETFKKAHYGHNGSDNLMLKDFCDAILNNKPSPLGIREGLAMTLPGIYGALSAREGGVLKEIIYPWSREK